MGKIDIYARDSLSYDDIMPALRDLEKATSKKFKGDLSEAVIKYLDVRDECRAKEALLGSEFPEEIPDVDGLFRWAVLTDHASLVSVCLDCGADSSWDNYWALIYSIAHGFDGVVEVLASSLADELPRIEARWDEFSRKQQTGFSVSDASYLLKRIRELRKSFSGSESFSPRDTASEQLTLFA